MRQDAENREHGFTPKSAMQNFYMLKSDSLRNDVLISYATIVSVLAIGLRQVCDDHHPKTFLKIVR